MTVRANKPAFNIREKLKELTQSIGLKGSELMRAATAQDARDLVSAGRKNIIINGDMAIDQRNSGSSVSLTSSNSSQYCVDRFQLWNYPSGVTGVYTIQRLTSNPAPGFEHYLRWTVTTAATPSGNHFYAIQQAIEGNNVKALAIGTSHPKPSVVSFWVRSSIAGNRSFSLYVAGATTVNYTVNYTINTADVWEYKTIKIPPLASGNGTGTGISTSVIVSWSMGMGTTYGTTDTTDGFYSNKYELGNAVKQVQFANSTFDITGVQFEVGKNATDFEYLSYGEQLALCQRYYYRITPGLGAFWGTGVQYNSTQTIIFIPFPVIMRDAVTAVETTGSASDYRLIYGTGTANCSTVPTYGGDANRFSQTVNFNVSSGAAGAAGDCVIGRSGSNNAFLAWSAEL